MHHNDAMRMLSRTTWAVVPVLTMVTLAGCSGATPTKSFEVEDGTTRVVELIDQRGDVSRKVDLKTPARSWYLRMDCIAEGGDKDGEIVVVVSGVGEGAVSCASDSDGSSGSIRLDIPEREMQSDIEIEVEVRVPKGARWSAAVDVKTADG